MSRAEIKTLRMAELKADLRQAARLALMAGAIGLIFPAAALAQAVNIDLGTGAGLTQRVVQLIGLLTVLSLAPSIVIMTTSFVRMVVVLSLLRTALGIQQSPPNAVLISLALFMSAIVMTPTLQRSYDLGIRPLMDNQMELPAAFEAASGPVKTFMLSQVDRSLHPPFEDSPSRHRPGCPDPGRDPGLHDFRAEDRLRNRLPALYSLPGH